MKKFMIPFLIFSITLFIGCSSDEPVKEEIPEISEDAEIQDFIWQGLNTYYLWQENVPDLSDSRIEDKTAYANYINNAPEPETFFESLIYKRDQIDKWSWIVDDYVALEDMFQGVYKSNGVEFELFVMCSTCDEVYAMVRYILPNTSASEENIHRGDIIMKIDGVQLNRSNYRELLFFGNDAYQASLGKIEDGNIVGIDVTVSLVKEEYTENPVFITKTFDVNGRKIGYLLYNSFTSNFDSDLNTAFSTFKNEGISDLVLDLRYNGGGSVQTAIYLASMITGQYKGELFTKERWNSKIQAEIEASHPDWLVNNFTDKLSNGEQINSLNFDNLYMIVTNSSASASELIINGLKPYINVKLIGEKTVGKYVASVTLYDSPDFTKRNVNPRHKYALQPIVLEEVNKLGENDKDGFDPDIPISEDYTNMGVLGERNEPLLKTAINSITGNAAKYSIEKPFPYENLGHSKMYRRNVNTMFVDYKPFFGEIFTKKDLLK
jgi:C-terminal processing protease CtpA/Prc